MSGAPSDVVPSSRRATDARTGLSRTEGVLLVACLAWGVFAFGAVYPWAYWPLAGGIAMVGAMGLTSASRRSDPRARTLATILAVTGAAISLQIVPLPEPWLARLSPSAGTFFERLRLGFRPDPNAWFALSIDPPETAVALALFCALAMLLVGLTRSIRAVGVDWLLTQITGLGTGVAVLGVVQRVLVPPIPPLVYGVWKPLEGGSPFGPFVNRNHFAGWMIMAIPVVLGYGSSLASRIDAPAHGESRAWLRSVMTLDSGRILPVAFAAVAMALSLALSGSRSGILSFAVGVAAIAAFVLRRVRHRLTRRLAISYLALVVLGAIVWADPGGTIERFLPASNDLGQRVLHWHDTWRVIRDFPLTGTGLGTYGRAMLVYQSGGRELMYAQAHNDYLQLLAEGGALVALPAAALIVVLVRSLRHRLATDEEAGTYWIRVGAIGGLAGIAAQSLVEFSLQIPGNTTLFIVLLALALHRPSRSRHYAHRV